MNHAQRYFIEEFAEDYQAGRMSRRELLRRVVLITSSAPIAASAPLALGCGSKSPAQNTASSAPATQVSSAAPATAPAQVSPTPNFGANTMPPTARSDALIVQPNDPEIRAEKVQFPGAAGPVFGYLARPKSGPPAPGIIVVPENMGLIEPNMDIARRYAKEGFAALAVDLVSREGGTDKYAGDPAQIPAILSRSAPADLIADLNAGLTYLKTADSVRKDGFGVTGFCFGGNQTFGLAIASPDIRAAVPHYGTVNAQDLAKSQAAFLIFYGETDTRVTSQAQAVEQTLQKDGRPFEVHIEPGAGHAFFNNRGAAYNPAAARDAWPRSIAWLTKYLKS